MTDAQAAPEDPSAQDAPPLTSGDQVLTKLVELDYCTWQYTEDPSGAWHLGPMAQDFREAFGLGHHDPQLADGWEYILPVDHLGVHGVAIQQLHRMLMTTRGQVSRLQARIDELEKSESSL